MTDSPRYFVTLLERSAQAPVSSAEVMPSPSMYDDLLMPMWWTPDAVAVERVGESPLCRCTDCLIAGKEVVDWRRVRSVGDFTVWECNQCGRGTVLATYYQCASCAEYYASGTRHDHNAR